MSHREPVHIRIIETWELNQNHRAYWDNNPTLKLNTTAELAYSPGWSLEKFVCKRWPRGQSKRVAYRAHESIFKLNTTRSTYYSTVRTETSNHRYNHPTHPIDHALKPHTSKEFEHSPTWSQHQCSGLCIDKFEICLRIITGPTQRIAFRANDSTLKPNTARTLTRSHPANFLPMSKYTCWPGAGASRALTLSAFSTLSCLSDSAR